MATEREASFPGAGLAPLERVRAMVRFDREQGAELVVGLDEAGRGPWAGPVTAAAVCFPPGFDPTPLPALDDSKKLTPHRREQLAESISRFALAVGVGTASPKEIDELDIEKATFLAMRRALLDCGLIPDLALVDGRRDPGLGLPTRCFVRGDSRSAAIAAASIVAKTTRDRHMELLGGEEDRWGFAKHKGYGTLHHQRALAVFGVSEHHRITFKPVARRIHQPPPSDAFLELWTGLIRSEDIELLEAAIIRARSGGPLLDTQEAWLLARKVEEVSARLAKAPIEATARGVGALFEDMVRRYLTGKGLAILEQNFHTPRGEIDLIARDEATLVFIEVKMRRGNAHGTPAEAVDGRKRRRMLLAALEYLSEFPDSCDCRFDVIALAVDPQGLARLDHFPNAFEATGEDLP